MTRFLRERVWRVGCAVGGLTAAILFSCGTECWAQFGTGLVPRHLAQSNGLERAWFARAEVNPARSELVRCILDGDELFVLTSAGVVQAMDANTGATKWITRIGKPEYPSLGPAANDDFVGVINGSTLYLLDRARGGIMSERRVGGPPGGGPALGEHYVFVPLMTGRVEGYPLDRPTDKPWFYQSWGHALSSPRVTPDSVVWGTDSGFLYVARADHPRIRYRLQSTGEFSASPAFREPLIFAVSASGECFAIDEERGQLRWKFATGYPTERGPAVVGDRLYLTTEEPMLHAVDANTGVVEWEAPGISQFAAVSKTHVFGVDRFGTIHVLDSASGAPLGQIVSGGTLNALVNDQTDRLYLISKNGLIQCLHEIGDKKPTYYRKSAKRVEAEATPEDDEYRGDLSPPEEDSFREEPALDADPFEAPLDDRPDPFGAPAATPVPADDSFGTDDDNPFG